MLEQSSCCETCQPMAKQQTSLVLYHSELCAGEVTVLIFSSSEWMQLLVRHFQCLVFNEILATTALWILRCCKQTCHVCQPQMTIKSAAQQSLLLVEELMYWQSDCCATGCAFVTLSSRQCAQNAIRSLHHSRTLEVSGCVYETALCCRCIQLYIENMQSSAYQYHYHHSAEMLQRDALLHHGYIRICAINLNNIKNVVLHCLFVRFNSVKPG